MLRVSSLGLTRYHDTSRLLPFHLRRSSSKVAVHGMPDTTPCHRNVLHGQDFGGLPDECPLEIPNTVSAKPHNSPPAEIPVGRRRAVIPPLCPQNFSRKIIGRVPEGTLIIPSEKKDHASAARSVQLPSHPRDQAEPPHTQPRVDLPYTAGAPPSKKEEFENIMATTASATEAWNAYQALMAIPREPHSLPVPYAHLHRLARLLASTRPRTRTLFLRLLSVLSTIHATGGYVKLWQWNALVDCAGKGWRKTRQEDFKAALDVFEDLMAQRSPGARFSGGSPVRPVPEAAPTVHPDIVTYTTLLNIAGRTLNEATLRRATILLESSRLLPNRITHLALVRYFARKNQLQGVRATLFNLKDQGFEMGLDGLNACIWAYARSGRLDVASTVYRALRHNLVPEDEAGENAITASVKRLSRVDGLTIPLDIKPDNTTFYTLIQAFAYHGDLIQCLRVFMDMITLSDADVSGHDHASPRVPNITSPTLPAFRAIFLGFARHGMPPAHLKNAGPLTLRLTSSAWTYDNLHILYQSFLALPHDVRPSDRTIYWVIKAFATTSGNDIRKLRRIWEQLETRFGGGWGGRLERFRHAIYGSPEK